MGIVQATREGFRAPTRPMVRRFAVASLVANVVIVVTGSAVRLTGSGLGCPTWPRCSGQSFVTHSALGVHGVIEFGNRMLTFVLAAVAIATWVLVMRYRPRRRSLVVLATLLALSVPAQAVLGGLTVLTDLNPWAVSTHLLFSLAIIALAVVFVRRVDEGDKPARPTVPRPVVFLARTTYAASWVVLGLGTVVTGSGPHAGDVDSPRNGLPPAAVSQLHADLVFLLVGLTIGTLLALHAIGAPERACRAAAWLLCIELLQGVVGVTQYFTDLPIVLVGLHVLGAALVSGAASWLMLGLRDRGLQGPAEEPIPGRRHDVRVP
ncbi:MAG: COX15/CtaA family protein [Nocardioidaceae bacterium]